MIDKQQGKMANKTIHRNLMIEKHELRQKLRSNSRAPEGSAVPAPLVSPIVLLLTNIIYRNCVCSNIYKYHKKV